MCSYGTSCRLQSNCLWTCRLRVKCHRVLESPKAHVPTNWEKWVYDRAVLSGMCWRWNIKGQMQIACVDRWTYGSRRQCIWDRPSMLSHWIEPHFFPSELGVSFVGWPSSSILSTYCKEWCKQQYGRYILKRIWQYLLNSQSKRDSSAAGLPVRFLHTLASNRSQIVHWWSDTSSELPRYHCQLRALQTQV